MKYLKYLILCVFVFSSCEKDNDDDTLFTLASYINGQVYELGAVIACAASDEISNEILTFYYLEEDASNIQFYETVNAEVDKLDFSKYIQVFLESEPFFNGDLGKFTQNGSVEKWIIITFELHGEIKISNPIRSKQLSKPTVWTDAVTIDQTESTMPDFMWEDNAVGDNAIYFQVISDHQNNLLSGTYTYENHFQYYNISNVILNVTTQTPPALIVGNTYNFTLMDVSEDNWVNLVVLKMFESQ
ncbi:MAG: hypothetical protein ABJL44_04760 [Algibacter sp.]